MRYDMMKRLGPGVLLLCLLPMISSCATAPRVVTKTKLVVVTIPGKLLRATPIPQLPPAPITGDDLTHHDVAVQEALKASNCDKADAADYVAKHGGPPAPAPPAYCASLKPLTTKKEKP